MKLELHDALCYGTFALDLLSTPSNPSSLFRTSSCRPAPVSIFVPCLPNASSHNPLHSHIDHIALPSSQLPFCIGFRLKKSAMASTCFSFSSSLCCALKSTCMASSVVWFATDKCQMRNLAVFMLVGWGNCFMRFCSSRRKGNDHASEFGLFHCTPLCSSSNSLSCLWRIWTVSSYFSIPKRASPARQLLLPLVEPCVISLEHGALNAVQIEWR